MEITDSKRNTKETFKLGKTVFIKNKIRSKLNPLWLGLFESVDFSRNKSQVKIQDKDVSWIVSIKELDLCLILKVEAE